ncbi:CHASE2 domain-containing protein [Sphingomonas sp. GlSt437]|uniref:CHASE2 domain-containing protein n=1 Tax=Sphingomonas sp. GlSt437 TaxID=3389970 RepID=UPI003A875FD2
MTEAAAPPRPPLATRLAQGARAAGPARLALALLIIVVALIVASASWRLPLIGDAERIAYDLRETAFAPRVDQDPRISLIVYNDQTLIATKKRSPLDRGLLARALKAIDALRPRRIGIDILFDQPQDEDAELIAVLRGMKTPTFVAFADARTNADNVLPEQAAFLADFMRRLRGGSARPASIRLKTDPDNVARSWPDQPAGLPPLLALAMEPRGQAFAGYTGSLRYRLPQSADRPVFASLPIDLLADPAMAPALASQIAGRDVLIGGDIVDVDRFQTPMTGFADAAVPGTGKTMIGLEVHATMLAQLLDGALLHPLAAWLRWTLAALVVLAAIATTLAELNWWRLTIVLVGQIGLMVVTPFVLQARGFDTQFLPALGWLLGWGLAFAAAGSAARAVGAEQRRFAQSALGKYLPRDIARRIIDEPERLALHGERREIFVLFSDLEGFTKLSHALPPETVASLLNRYLDLLSNVVLDHGGTIDKFVGDAVVAFWGAPIARADDGANAARAAYAMWRAGEDFRKSLPADGPTVGRTRVGLHFGAAVVGNFGGEGRIQYTALGDAMNTASRLESANKQLGTSVIVSREAMSRSGLDWWRPLGSIRLRGRATPVDIFEPAPDVPVEDRRRLAELIDDLCDPARGARAAEELVGFATSHPGDAALVSLVNRVKEVRYGEAYDLA